MDWKEKEEVFFSSFVVVIVRCLFVVVFVVVVVDVDVVGLHFLSVLVSLLHNGQLGVWISDREVGVWWLAGSVEHQGPLFQEPVVNTLAVEANLTKLTKFN